MQQPSAIQQKLSNVRTIDVSGLGRKIRSSTLNSGDDKRINLDTRKLRDHMKSRNLITQCKSGDLESVPVMGNIEYETHDRPANS